MAKKKVIVSRSGLTTCPSCMSHITLDVSLEHTECPFCHTNLIAERRQDDGVFGCNALQTLRKSKSAMIAAALGVSLSMAACGEEEEGDEKDMSAAMDMQKDMRLPSLDMAYGGPPIDMYEEPNEPDMDMGVEVLDEGAPAMDMYGGPPIDMD